MNPSHPLAPSSTVPLTWFFEVSLSPRKNNQKQKVWPRCAKVSNFCPLVGIPLLPHVGFWSFSSTMAEYLPPIGNKMLKGSNWTDMKGGGGGAACQRWGCQRQFRVFRTNVKLATFLLNVYNYHLLQKNKISNIFSVCLSIFLSVCLRCCLQGSFRRQTKELSNNFINHQSGNSITTIW